MFGLSRHSKNPTSNGGTGYGGDAARDKKARVSGKKKAEKESQKRLDNQEKEMRKSLSTLDTVVPSEALIGTIREILRLQVPSEWSKRKSLYVTALKCCRLIAENHPKLIGDKDDDESILSALNEFAQTAEMISNQKIQQERKLIKLVLEVHAEASNAFSKVAAKAEMTVMDPHEHYRQALRPFRFELVESIRHHTFAKHRQRTGFDTPNLFRELTTYKTSLPIEYGSSIFVRAVENRLDLLRVLITGPEDTPYANGCFIFDVWLCDYPKQPPKVKYLSTGNSRYRFNPNLYEDGKVCLSLLGTWSGPGWISGESTLLQVLVSIQSLILVPDPYFNEPGYESSRNSARGVHESTRYNTQIKRQTLEVCILPYFRETAPHEEFGEAIQKHFQNKRSALQKQLFRWYKDDAQLEKLYSEYLSIVEDSINSKKRPRVARAPARQVKTRTVDGVVEIEDSDEEDESTGKLPKVIDLDNETKPRASTKTAEIDLCDDDEPSVNICTGDDAKIPAASAGLVVDLT